MADGVAITAGSGTTIATDDAGAGGHVQVVKLAVSANGDATLLTADGSGLEVQLGAAIPAGTNAIGKLSANSGVDIGDVDVTSISAGTNAIGNVGLIPRTTGGLTPFKTLDLDESEEEIKGSAGQVYWYFVANLHASSARYVKFYDNTAAGTTVGTTTPVLTIPLAAGEKANVAIPQGFAFGTGITVAATTGLADNDTGAPGANEVVLNVGYA